MSPQSRDDSAQPPAPLWATLTATFFGIGHLHPGPGTWASVATVLLWAAIRLRTAVRAPHPGRHRPGHPRHADRHSRRHPRRSRHGIKDPQFVVIDEVAGQLIALIAVPLTWKTFLAGFILFRAFDIVKPPPVRQLEKLPEGTGIVLDDVAAGILRTHRNATSPAALSATKIDSTRIGHTHGILRPHPRQEKRQRRTAH